MSKSKIKREPKYPLLNECINYIGEIQEPKRGGQVFVSEKINIAQPAIWLWIHENGLPDTELLTSRSPKKTRYAEKLEELSNGKYEEWQLIDEKINIEKSLST